MSGSGRPALLLALPTLPICCVLPTCSALGSPYRGVQVPPGISPLLTQKSLGSPRVCTPTRRAHPSSCCHPARLTLSYAGTKLA